MHAKRLFIWVGLSAGIACLVGLYLSWHFWVTQPRPIRQIPQIEQTKYLDVLWQIKLVDQNGNAQSLAAYRGKPLVVNFWATWCEPCREEMPVLSALQNKYAAKNIYFVGIAADSAANVARVMQKMKLNYPLYSAGYEGLELARILGNKQGGLPFTVLIDASGEIHSALLGSITRKKERLKALLEQLDAL